MRYQPAADAARLGLPGACAPTDGGLLRDSGRGRGPCAHPSTQRARSLSTRSYAVVIRRPRWGHPRRGIEVCEPASSCRLTVEIAPTRPRDIPSLRSRPRAGRRRASSRLVTESVGPLRGPMGPISASSCQRLDLGSCRLAGSSDAGEGTRTLTPPEETPDFKSGAYDQFRHPGGARIARVSGGLEA